MTFYAPGNLSIKTRRNPTSSNLIYDWIFQDRAHVTPSVLPFPPGVALAWPLDKYECLTVDIKRVSETRRWGRDLSEASEDNGPTRPAATPSAPTAAPQETGWGGPLGMLMRLTGRGMKRPREEAGRGEPVVVQMPPREAANPWQVTIDRRNVVVLWALR